MHFTCEKQAINIAIDQAEKTVGSAGNMPIISHICFDLKGNNLELIATDLHMGTINKVNVNGIENGSIAVLASSLKNIISKFDLGEVEFEVNPRSMMVIKNKVSRYELPTLPSNEFPTPKPPQTKCFFNIEGKQLIYMLKSVGFAAADASSTRVNMQSVLFDLVDGNLVLVSTDGKRMAKVVHDLNDKDIENMQVIVPIKYVKTLIGLLSNDETYRVDICDKQIFFSSKTMMFNCAIIDSTFPDYTRFFNNENEDKKRCVIDRLSLLNALNRVNVVVEKKTNMELVEFNFKDDILTLSSFSSTVGSGVESLAVNYDGDELSISFNSSYITGMLSSIVCDQVEIELKNAVSGVMIRPVESKDYDYICMPMRR